MRWIFSLLPFGMVFAGLFLVFNPGWALVGTGGLMWLDMNLPDRGS